MVNELLYQIEATKARLIIAHPDAIDTVSAAAQEAGIPPNRIIIFNKTGHGSTVPGTKASQFITVNELVEQGRHVAVGFKERRLARGEGKTKLAFLNFSSGTTGKPKVRLMNIVPSLCKGFTTGAV